MAYYSGGGGLGSLPPVVRTFLIVNVAVFLAQNLVPGLTDWGSLHYWTSTQFKPHQLITMMFLHGGFSHILFNMLVLWMFGSILENFWGSKRFLNFYLICGIGASVVTLLSVPLTAAQFVKSFGAAAGDGGYSASQIIEAYKQNYAALGASGALMGVMAAFAYLFPNTELMIFPLPIQIKAKYLIPFYFLIDLFGGLGIAGVGDNVAHFAHLGGALIGLIIVIIWNKTNRSSFY